MVFIEAPGGGGGTYPSVFVHEWAGKAQEQDSARAKS